MNKLLAIILALLATLTTTAQPLPSLVGEGQGWGQYPPFLVGIGKASSLHVQTGSVTYQITASQAGEMLFDDATTLTILNRAYPLRSITQIYFSDTVFPDDAVNVTYADTATTVTVAGNIACYLDITVEGAHVTITPSDDLDREITYTLQGSSTDGSFTLYGSYKATVALEGLTLTNPHGAAFNIQNGKRIDISVKNTTVNTLADGSDGSQKACLYVKGHAEFKGKGTLNVAGNTAHAIKTGDYMTVKNCTLNVTHAQQDGIHANEYLLISSGTVTISDVGDDAIQAELDGSDSTGETANHEDEDTGNIYIDGGTLTLTTNAAGAKALTTDGLVRITDGALTINASGAVDRTDPSDLSYVAGIKADHFVLDGGAVAITVKGTAGRGVFAHTITTNGGALTISNSAAPTTISSDVKSARGLSGLDIALNAGTITINMTGNAAKGIKAGDGTKSTSGGGGGGWPPGPGGGGGWPGGGTTWSNVTGSYTQGLPDGTGPTLSVTTTGSAYSSSSAKAIKAICAATIYGGQTEVSTKTSGAEGLESKTSIDIRGGQHYFMCYDDCLNSSGMITFDGGVTVCYSNGNDAVDSNYGRAGAITIGDGTVFAYTTRGAPEEGLDCDNNSYIAITGHGIGISAGASQGGGGGWGGGGGSSNTITNAQQGYAFVTTSISYAANRYYTLADASGTNFVTYSFPAKCSSTLALFTATGMVKGSQYNVKYSTDAPTDATTSWHGLYLGSTHQGTTSVTTFTAK